MIFDSYDMSPVLFGTGKCARKSWSYFTENELMPGAIRWHNYKFQFNLAATTAPTGGLAVDTTWDGKGPRSMSLPFPRSSISGLIRRNATTSS